ncbi:MAG: class I SAM-dependent methyltransferase [Acholeplasmataceae bacterium]|jgi:16S rRNA (guanine1207-N2)-methyltransferase|nr:class I SAM-dependent methyltransferase [Acholeplasmataceae bacterium]
MSHYYINDETLNHNVKIIDININEITLKLHTDLGVFSKTGLDYGSRVLLENIELPNEKLTIVDMGCGYGPIGLYLAKAYQHAFVIMTDINLRAVELAKKNSQLNHLKNVEISQGFLFENVQNELDVVVTNPPIRAGKQTVFALYDQAFQKLKKGGLLFVVIQKKQGAPSTQAKLESLFSEVNVIDKNKGYWVLSAKK